MRSQLFTLRYSATLGGFDDTPLLDYTRDKEVLTFREHFFLVSDVPHMTCVLLQLDGIGPGKVKRYGKELLELVGGARPEAGVGGETETLVVVHRMASLVSTPQPKLRSRRPRAKLAWTQRGCPARST